MVAGRHAGEIPKRGALVLGCVAALAAAIVGCTKIADGAGAADTAVAPAYRTSVSMSISASSVTSQVRESQRQQSVTTRAMRTSCEVMATTSEEAIDKVNDFVAAYNAERSTGPTEGPAIEALNDSADSVENSYGDALPASMRDAFNAYTAAAREVAKAIGTHASTGEFNRRVDNLNDTKSEALTLCSG